MPSLVGVITPQDYGATGNGTTDDTNAVQLALNAANTSGSKLYFPDGTYLITPTGSPAVGLTMVGVSSGYQGLTLEGAANQGVTFKKAANGTLLQMSGPSSSPSTGATHCRFITLNNLGFNGNGFTGPIFQTYYADNIEFRNVYVNNNADIIQDCAEYWDSRYYNCVFGGSGSATANADAPNIYLRNSAAASGFGSSTGTTNMIVFNGCRWEAFTTGAVKISQGTGGSGGPNLIFLTDCKMETSNVNGSSSANQASHLIADTNSRGIYIKHLYAYSGGFQGGYSTAVDMINMSAQSASLDDILLSSGGSATVANGITVNAPTAGETVTVENVTATWTTNPTGALINYGGTANGTLVVENYSATGGTLVAGTVPTLSGGVTSTTTVSNTAALTNLYSQAIPGIQAHVGSMYRLTASGTYGVLTATTPTIAFQLFWGGTNIGTIPAITTVSGITGASWKVVAEVTFRTATSCDSNIELKLSTSTATGAASLYLNVPSAPVTVTTNTAQNLTVAVQWGTANASNTISLLGGGIERVY